MNTKPLTQAEYEQLFRLLDLVSQNIERLINSGTTMAEGFENQEIQSSENRIDSYRQKIQMEQKRIRRIRDILRHRSQIRK